MAAPTQGGSYLVRFASEQRAFAAGQSIFTAGDPGDVMYVVKEGEVEVLVRDQVVETIGPGGILGEMEQTPYFALEVMRVMARRLRQMDLEP